MPSIIILVALIFHYSQFGKESARNIGMDSFFNPEGVAVIGSLSGPIGLGYVAIRNMQHLGFCGKVYPVNPSYSEVLGLKAYSSIEEITEPVDLAIVITPPPTIPAIVEQCARQGVKAVLIVSENFAEAGEEGAQLQRQVVAIAQRNGIRVMGPNTIGLLNTANGFTTIPYLISYDSVRTGKIAYCSQSGIVGATGKPLEDLAYPISKMCDIGNKCDVNEIDLLDYLTEDPETGIVAIHLEDVKDGRKFIDKAGRLVARKPLLVFKPGRSEAGARAMSSHTGSLSGNEQVYQSAFRQAGAIRVSTWREFWEIPKVFAYQPLPQGNRIAVLTLTGGAGVVAVDTAIDAGLTVASLSATTSDWLASYAPRLASNPVDMAPVLSVAENPLDFNEEAMAKVLDDVNVDCATIAAYAGQEAFTSIILAMFERLKRRISKPVTVWVYGMQLSVIEEMSRQLEVMGFPTYFDIETAVKALGVAAEYASIQRNFAG
ncbi:MAG: CoA-binding protein [Dehalococcoidia bacterium]|nr:MAG: CoA-binding protein [Dehalococcoidia bacterium]